MKQSDSDFLRMCEENLSDITNRYLLDPYLNTQSASEMSYLYTPGG
jgi:hypothetical protein